MPMDGKVHWLSYSYVRSTLSHSESEACCPPVDELEHLGVSRSAVADGRLGVATTLHMGLNQREFTMSPYCGWARGELVTSV